MTRVCVVVRHGNTFATGEAPRRIGARTDLPLVESGREQARQLAALFRGKGWRFDRVLASPLRRTQETANLILSAMSDDATIHPCEWLAEIDHGPDENRTEDEVVARIGTAALAAWDIDGVAPPGWHVDRSARVEAWRDFLEELPEGRTLLVTSNGAARFGLMADETLIRQAGAFTSLKLNTGAYGVISVEDGSPHLLAWNLRP